MNASSAAADKPLISVIIPVYNAEKYLERCVKSVLGQTYSNLEILLVDDGSPDNCGRMCDEFAAIDSRIRVIHKENGGVASARNAALDAMTGKYVTFVDSDDYAAEDYIQYLYSLISEYNGDVSVCSYISIYENGNEIHNVNSALTQQVYDKTKALSHLLYDTDGTMLWGKLFKSNLFDKVRCPNGRAFEDVAIVYLIYAKSEKIVFGNQEKYFYAIRDNSITTSPFSAVHLDHITSTDEMCNYISVHFPLLKRACNRRIMYACVNVLRREVLSANRDKKLEKQLAARVRSVRWDVLTNPQCSKRDKAAVLSLMLGPGFFRFAWKVYAKLTHRT